MFATEIVVSVPRRWAQWMTPLAGSCENVKRVLYVLLDAKETETPPCLLVFARSCGKSIEPMVQQCSVLPIVAAHGGCYGYP